MKETKRLDGEIYRRGKSSIAHGALTNSKRAESFVKEVYPAHLKSGQGGYVFDTYGNQYIDFICGLGSNLLGYAQEDVTKAIEERLGLGTTLSLGTELEVKCAERIKEFFPFIELLRFLKTGGEATTAACLIARAFTGRPKIFSAGYHAWHPEFQSLTPPHYGVNKCTFMESIGEDCYLEKDTAAVIVEPIVTDYSPKRVKYLTQLRENCTENGTLLIFDEVITGFRWPTYSFSQSSGIIPDLICLGKAIASGMPLSVVGGKKEVMESDYFVSSTFAGETLSLAACLKTMDLLQTSKFDVALLWEKGERFLNRFNAIWPEGLTLQGYATRSIFIGDELTKALFMQECCRAGILIGPSFFFAFPHIPLIDDVLSTMADILGRIRRKEVFLLGEMPIKPYAEKIRSKDVI